jgi:MFS family permease
MHAMHSLGGVLGGGLAATAAYLELNVVTHFALVAVSVAASALVASRALLPPEQLHVDHEQARSGTPLLSGWTARLLVLGAAAFVFTLAEGSALDWSAVLLNDHHQASPTLAAAGLAIFQAAVTLGRACGDRIIDTAGPVAVFTVGTLLGGLGFTAGLLLDTTVTTIAGLALLGLGLATLLPISISAAGTSSYLPVPAAVARVSTLGYLGSFTGPTIIGYLAHHSSLPVALLLPAAAVALCATAAPATRRPRPSAARDLPH